MFHDLQMRTMFIIFSQKDAGAKGTVILPASLFIRDLMADQQASAIIRSDDVTNVMIQITIKEILRKKIN